MENSVAIYLSGAPIYWHSIVMALAAVAAILCAVFIRSQNAGSADDILHVALLGFIPAMLLGRVYYCYFAQESFADVSEMLTLGRGGFALYGAMAGYLLTVWLYCRFTHTGFASLMDAIAPGAALGIAIGRAGSIFSGDDFGRTVSDPAQQKLPFAFFSESHGEWRMAIFSLEAIAAVVIFLLLLALMATGDQGRFHLREGDTALMFLFLYGISQTVFESMRNDSLFLISLGFVRISQVISILLATAVFVVFSVRSVKNGLSKLHFLGWLLCLGCIALAFWMEFCITTETAVRNHTIMSLCLLFYMFVGLTLYFDGNSDPAEPEEISSPAAPAEIFADIPVAVSGTGYGTDSSCGQYDDEPVDFLPSAKAAQYTLRVRGGYPDSSSPLLCRNVINIQNGGISAQDLLDLIGIYVDLPSDRIIAAGDGYYHLTVCEADSAGDMYVYLNPVELSQDN